MKYVITLFLLIVGLFAAEAVTDQELAAAIKQLGAENFRDRKQAEQFLWEHGDAALAALEAAAASDDPEIRTRARRILENVRQGIFPDTPEAAVDLIRQYRAGDLQVRRDVGRQLLGLGPAGRQVFLRLLRGEPNDEVRRELLRNVPAGADLAAQWVQGEIDDPIFREFLELHAHYGRGAADLAAYSLVRGDLKDRIARLEQAPDKSQEAVARLRAMCYRADGQLEKALAVAQAMKDDLLTENLLLELGDFKTLARTSRRMSAEDIDSLGYQAAFLQLAGDNDGYRKARSRLKQFAKDHPEDSWYTAEALLICGEVDAAIKVLIDNHRYSPAFALLATQLRLPEALELGQQAAKEGNEQLPALQFAEARLRAMHGDRDGARQILANRYAADPNPESRAAVVEVEADIDPQLALSHAMELIASPPAFDQVVAAVAPKQAPYWTLYCLALPDADAETRRGCFKGLLEQLPGPDTVLEQFRKAEDRIKSLADGPGQDEWRALMEVAMKLHQFDAARRAATEAKEPGLLAGVALAQADQLREQKQWQAAAKTYREAWELNRQNALPLYLAGTCLTNAGQAEEGRKCIDQAVLLPLADAGRRWELCDGLGRRGLEDAAIEQCRLLLCTGEFGSWALNTALRRMSEYLAATKHDHTTAALYLRRCHLPCLRRNSAYMETAAYLYVNAGIHEHLARHRLQQGDLRDAVKEAELAFAQSPHDADFLIDLVHAADQHQSVETGDALMKQQVDRWQEVLRVFPNSPTAHNNIAWIQSRCHRDLEAALKHAQTAVRLEPEAATYLDTLAEANFQLGNREQAVNLAKQAAALHPENAFFKKRVEEFTTAPLPQK